jgi:hypothetical protein
MGAVAIRKPMKLWVWREFVDTRIQRAVDPEEAAKEVKRLQTKYGKAVSGEQLVQESRPKNAVCHDAFPWDDKKAAHERRLEVAGEILRGYWLVETQPEGPPVVIERNIAIRSETEGGARMLRPSMVYCNSEIVMKEPSKRADALASCLARLEGLRRSYEWLTELADVWKAIDKAKK